MDFRSNSVELEQRLMKQKYLKEQILDDNDFDAEEFVEFMRVVKPNVEGGDIDNWDYDELVQKVRDFKNMKMQLKGIHYKRKRGARLYIAT